MNAERTKPSPRNPPFTARLRTLNASAARGVLEVAGRRFACAVGRAGRRAIKREGDGATPVGAFSVRRVLWRTDRGMPPRTALPVRALRPDDGWCDAVGDRNYNRPVRHPYPASAERLWRNDHLYDVIVVLGANDRPRIQGRGSAIFMHLARRGYTPTAGCVALARRDLLEVLRLLRPGDRLIVAG